MLDLSKPSLFEALGLHPISLRARQALVALRGAEDVPPAQYDRSSLLLLDPRLSIPMWSGWFPIPRKAVLTNLFNHTQTPVERGWSVKRTQIEDFRGRKLTYDSHNGTDFSIPVGTVVRAPAPAVVARVYAEYNRGGHKVVLDHGGGLLTCSVHLARPLVREGDVLKRGQPFAVSGYSGLDGLVTFPWGIPHIHFNAWLGGEPVDPFARAGSSDVSLWRGGSLPVPVRLDGEGDEAFEPSRYDEKRVEEIIDSCVTKSVRDWLRSIEPLSLRGGYLVSERCYYPTRFRSRISPYADESVRSERLSMPFGDDQFDGVVFSDE